MNLTERQADQRPVEQMRADNLARANGELTASEMHGALWGDKPSRWTPFMEPVDFWRAWDESKL